MCTNPNLMMLRVSPLVASIVFAVIIVKIKRRVRDTPLHLEIDIASKKKRLKVLNRLHKTTFIFIFVSFYLYCWDLTRFIQNYGVGEPKCFDLASSLLFNDILWFLARFFAA